MNAKFQTFVRQGFDDVSSGLKLHYAKDSWAKAKSEKIRGLVSIRAERVLREGV